MEGGAPGCRAPSERDLAPAGLLICLASVDPYFLPQLGGWMEEEQSPSLFGRRVRDREEIMDVKAPFLR